MNPGSGKNLFRIAGKKGAGSRILNTSLVFRDINNDATSYVIFVSFTHTKTANLSKNVEFRSVVDPVPYLSIPRRTFHDLRIGGLDPQTLGRRSVHDDVDPEDLHRVQRVRRVHQGGQRDQGERGNARAHLEPHKIPEEETGAKKLIGRRSIFRFRISWRSKSLDQIEQKLKISLDGI